LTIVLIDRMIASLRESADAVMVDNIAASFDATEHLLEQGHEQIGIIVGPREIFTSQQRLLGYRQAMLGQGILARDQLVSFSDYTLQGGYESMKALLRDNPGMTAVFATNYEMTLGAIMALSELGVKVPGDMSFIGFDNMQLAEVVRPRLTIITQPLAAIGEAVAQRLLARLDAGEEHPSVITLKTSLQAGETVARR
jgi:LacI family transcriptional regulator